MAGQTFGIISRDNANPRHRNTGQCRARLAPCGCQNNSSCGVYSIGLFTHFNEWESTHVSPQCLANPRTCCKVTFWVKIFKRKCYALALLTSYSTTVVWSPWTMRVNASYMYLTEALFALKMCRYESGWIPTSKPAFYMVERAIERP